MACYRIFVRDNNSFANVGEIGNPIEFDYTITQNDVSSATLSVPLCHPLEKYLTHGYGLVIQREGKNIFSGPIQTIRTKEGYQEDGTYIESITVACASDEILLKNRLAYPSPYHDATQPPRHYSFHPIRTKEEEIETVLKEIVDRNIGASNGGTNRKLPYLRIQSDMGTGKLIRLRVSYDEMLELFKKVCGDNMRFWIETTQLSDGSWGLMFCVAPWNNKTSRVVISKERRNLKEYVMEESAPTANVVVMGADEDTTDTNKRKIIFGKNPESIDKHGRVEKFHNFNVNEADPDEIKAEMDMVLEQGKETISVTATTVSSEGSRIGEHYWVGDKVSLVIRGKEYKMNCYEVKGSWDQDNGEQIEATIGTLGERRAPLEPSHVISYVFDRQKKLESRVSRLERRL